MQINAEEIRNNSLVRYGFKVLLAQEFGLRLGEDETDKLLLARDCIEVYASVEEFLERTGWGRDNPEACSGDYLQENRICRKVNGEYWYFSRIRYEAGIGAQGQTENRQSAKGGGIFDQAGNDGLQVQVPV